VLCVHEDWESKGYYLYELNPAERPTLADPMIEAVRKVCPIETATVIDGREIAEPGIIRPISDPLLRELWPESIYLRAHHTQLSYTLESPSAFALEQRIAAHSAAIETAIARVIR
jgi:murein peptide amidase A